MHANDASKILSELKNSHGYVSADDEKTLELISRMVAGKPKVEADQRFLENLRSRLLLEASVPLISPWWKKWQNFAKFLSVPVALAGMAAIANTVGLFEVAKHGGKTDSTAYPVATVFTDSGNGADMVRSGTERNAMPSTDGAAKMAEPQTASGPNPLSSLKGTEGAKPDSAPKPENGDKPEAADRTLESVDSGISNIVGNTAESIPTKDSAADSAGFSAPMAMTAPSASSLKMTAPANVKITEYRYSYAGELPKLSSPLNVYERDPKLPLPKFSKAGSLGMTVSNDTENGYSTVMRDYEKWPETPCSDPECAQKKPLKESDVPADSVIVGIATGFAKEMGIDLTGYGTPTVDSSWKNALSQSSDPSFKIVPENLTVIFPRKVDGYEIQDDSGYPVGITFIVNHPTGRVQQVIGIETSTLASASSVSTIDQTTIMARLSNGGSAVAPVSESGATVVEIPMVRAKIGYSLQYAEKGGKWMEFYVPSVVFEISKAPKSGEYFRTRVVVPLADVTRR